jgi:hypothetical protein
MQYTLFALSIFVVSVPTLAADSLCTPEEKIVFSCVAGKGSKIASMCASSGLTAKSGTLYYRFGTSSNVELEYPNKPNGSAQHFKYAHYSRSETQRTEVTFDIGQFTYTIFDYDEERENPPVSRGVRVTTAGSGAGESTLNCKAAATSKLQQLEGKVPCDAESALSRCR